MTKPAPPATLVIFGILGDLTRRLLMPSLRNLVRDGLVGDDFRVIGVGRDDITDAKLREHLDGGIAEDKGGAAADKKAWTSLRKRVHYLRGDFDDKATFAALAKAIDGNAAFYLATPPAFFGPIVGQLGDVGLLDEANGFRRIAIEKPFGHDLQSAKALNAQLQARAAESQIYRVDHFLGKETVQNILVARFGNALAEAVWNARYIDHVQITAAETVTVGSRGKFYDTTGALRDMVPNHLFQLLALVGMEPPNNLGPDAIRDEKAKLLKAVRPVRPADAVRGQYRAGTIGNAKVTNYRAENEVAADSRTETYAALKLEIDSWRWAGVPFYLRTGKALAARDTEIVIQFRAVPDYLFDGVKGERPPNRLVLQIQPKEGISLGFVVKQPGPDVTTASASLDYCYADHFDLGRSTGYETLLHDLLLGNQTLFQRADMIEAGWAAVDPLVKAWAKGEPDDYRAGGPGPKAAADLIARDGRAWREIG